VSYEGYDQYLCGNGHYWSQDCYDDSRECPECKQPPVWWNAVDETNCMAWGYIDVDKFIATPAVNVTCPTCNHVSQSSPPIYRIPTKDETDEARTFRDEKGDIVFCSEELRKLEAEDNG